MEKRGTLANVGVDDRLRTTSPCAVCGRRVTGRDGDVKVYVEHTMAVLCLSCFDRHPNREDWTCRRPPSSRRRGIARIG
jgi:hypothetical protein